ncbi:hypothetical protein EJ73_01814 [Hoylesella shahii DSM 15611 = JCM 12083]|jgi:hypothetical protein|uniref:Uncharacterized protein n=1 Tax=Hoylesella shahii DSM 15611 = JCM 12083 TaxID=1122991 RepID=A0A318HX79_9BACT|nr:hypothetical protein EJ73_01814 [Hoylesella shahii DSM 15611 = JCM 12083]
MFYVDIKYITCFVCNKKNNSLSAGIESLFINDDLKNIYNIFDFYLEYIRKTFNFAP